MLFGKKKAKKVMQEEFPLDFTGITDESFWERAEVEIYSALKNYAAEASRAGKLGQRLFAQDVERGFALIDLLSKRFDVVVMNPPFGEFSKGYKTQAKVDYPDSYNDIFASFVDRMLSLLESRGLVGAITSRTGFFIPSLESWRTKVLHRGRRIQCMVDFGQGVMDEATVEAAAYCISKSTRRHGFPVVRLLGISDRVKELALSIDALEKGNG